MMLTIIIDEKLSPGQRISQACHATANFMLQNPGVWENESITILKAPKYVLREALGLGALGYTDPYYGEPKACAFTEISMDLSQLELA